MSKKHFEAIANSLRNSRPLKGSLISPRSIDDYSSRLYQWRVDVYAMANVCRECNGKFDKSKFYRACSFDESWE